MKQTAYIMRFLRSTILESPVRILFVILLMTLASVFEGSALAMLFPLLSLLGLGSETEVGNISNKMIDWLAGYGVHLNLYTVAALFVILALLQNIFFLAQTWFSAGLQMDMVKQWRCRLVDALLQCKWSYFSRQNSGELTHVLTVETGRASYLISHGSQILSLALTVLVYLGVAFYTSWKVTTLLMVCSFVIVGLAQLFVRGSIGITERQAELYKRFTSLAGEAIGGMKLIRAMDGASTLRQSLWPLALTLRQLEQRIHVQGAILRSSFEITAAAALMLVLIIGITILGAGGVTVLLIAALFVRLYPRISTIQQYVHQFRMAVPYYAAVIGLLDEAQNAAELLSHPQHSSNGHLLPPNLVLQNINVKYGDRVALRDLSLSIPARSTVAIAGASGAGKSTLVDALLCLVPIQSGTIAVDGVSISDVDLATWRRSVGYVPQDTFLFNASIRDNITFAQPDIGMNEIRDVARKAHILEFVESLPDGFDTIVGDRGVLLSGGQRQRIGIARALAGGKALLILDEATSALDSDTESAIMRDISDLHGQMTIIIIAHRLSTLRSADQIFVLDNGVLVEEGNWSSLVTRGGYFQRLWAMQTELPTSSSAIQPAARQAIS